MDLALAIEKLLPSAEYGGSTTANDEAAFDALVWTDARDKPTWAEIVAADALPPSSILKPVLVAMGQVKLADGDISEVKISAALAGAFLFGVGEIWCFFTEPQPDTDYIVLAYDSNTVRAYVEDEDKATEYFIIRVTDFSDVPTNPASLNFEVKRVI
jgi:hypothetical protein